MANESGSLSTLDSPGTKLRTECFCFGATLLRTHGVVSSFLQTSKDSAQSSQDSSATVGIVIGTGEDRFLEMVSERLTSTGKDELLTAGVGTLCWPGVCIR